MNELTLVLLIVTIALFVIGVVTKRNPINWLTFFVAICSIGQSLTDESLADVELILMIVPAFYIVLMSGWSAFSSGTN